MNWATSFPAPQYDIINVSDAGYNEIIDGVAGKSIVILQYALIVAGDITITWESEGGTVHSGPMAMKAGVAVPFNPTGHFRGDRDKGVGLFLGDAVQVGGHVQYVFV